MSIRLFLKVTPSPTFTKNTFETNNITFDDDDPFFSQEGHIQMLILSAFAPYELSYLSPWATSFYNYHGVDRFNNWNVDVDPIYNYTQISRNNGSLQELWIQTSTQSSVCTLGNISCNVDFDFVNGDLTLARYETSNFEPLYTPIAPNLDKFRDDVSAISYMSVFIALTSLISGNLSTALQAS